MSIKVQREDMGMYFINDDYPLQKNAYKYADISEAIKLRDKLNEVIDKFTQGDIDVANYELQEEVYSEQKTIKEVNIKEHKGYVYLLRGENGKYKIGASKNPKRRCKELCLSSCENHTLVYFFYSKNMYASESDLHEKYFNKKSHSEWFNLSDIDVDFIKRTF